MGRRELTLIGNKCLQRDKAVATASQSKPIACGATPMDGAIYDASEEISDMEIETNQNHTYNTENERTPSPMKMDR